MKKIFLTAALAAFLLPGTAAFAQQQKREHKAPKPRPEITEIVHDLSSGQKSKLDAISKESKERISKLRRDQRSVRDSIESLMEADGDQSRALYPLFDREARLQAEISREMYATKLRFDEVLNDEQRAELTAAHKRPHHPRKNKKK